MTENRREVKIMPYDYSKLLGKITEVFRTQRNFSQAIGLSEHSVSMKLCGKVEWKQGEISKACEALKLECKDISQYFFTKRQIN